jgi:hypothetical protein
MEEWQASVRVRDEREASEGCGERGGILVPL